MSKSNGKNKEHESIKVATNPSTAQTTDMGTKPRRRSRSQIKEQILSSDPTADYQSTRFTYYGELFVQRLPLWRLWTARMMLTSDPIINFSLNIRNAALAALEINVKARNEQIAVWVKKQWDYLWNQHRPKLISAKKWGFAPLQCLFKMNKRTGLIDISGVKDFAPEDSRALEYKNKLCGQRIKGTPMFHPQCLWMKFGEEFGSQYGTAVTRRQYPAWYEKWMDHGAKRLVQLRMIKDAYIGDIFWYPPNVNAQLPNGQTIPWRDLMREIAENRLSGAALTLPRLLDSNGKELTGYNPPISVPGASDIFNWVDYCDDDILKGADIPIEVVKAADTGSGYSGRSIPFLVLLSVCNNEAVEIVQCVRDQVLRPLAWLNWGGDVDFEIDPIDLVKSFAGNAAGSPMGGGAIGGQPSQVPQQVPEQAPQGGVQFGEFKEEDHPRNEKGEFTKGYKKAVAYLHKQSRENEHQVIVDHESGKHLHTDMGVGHQTNIPVKFLTGDRKFHDLHSHPGDDGPSDEDWAMLGWGNVQSITAVGKTKIHKLYKTNSYKRITPRELREKWNELLPLAEDKNSHLSGDDYVHGVLNTINEGVANHFRDRGLRYEVHPIEDDKQNQFREDLIPGGKGDKAQPEDFDPEQVAMGIKVEMEHTSDPKIALEIAMDHLTEDPHYYTKLKKVEQHAESGVGFDDKHLHAPPGGVTIHGVKYEGGEFIPKDVIDSLTPEDQSKLRAGAIARHIKARPELSKKPEKKAEKPTKEKKTSVYEPPSHVRAKLEKAGLPTDKRTAPGAQLPEHVKTRMKKLGMLNTFPPAYIPLEEITIADLSQPDEVLKQGSLMSWRQESETTPGRWQIAHRYAKEFKQESDEAKWELTRNLIPHMTKLHGYLSKAIQTKQLNTRERQAAAIANIVREVGLRPTDSADSVKHGHFGIASLQARHCKIKDDGIHLSFIGKKGEHNKTVVRDPVNVSFLKEMLVGKMPKDFVFSDANSNHANQVLKKIVTKLGGPEDVSLKDLRTTFATQNAMKEISNWKKYPKLTGNAKKDAAAIKRTQLEISEKVSVKLCNTKSMAFTSYIDPHVWEDFYKELQRRNPKWQRETT